MVMNTGSIPQNLRPGIRSFFGLSYQNKETFYDRILDVKTPSQRAYEEDVMISTLGLPQVKTEGAPVVYDSGNQMNSTRFRHVEYALGFAITQIMYEDGVAVPIGEEFAKALKQNMMRARDIIATGVYSGGFSVEQTTEGGDGVALFSNAHPTPGGNLSNVPSVAATISEAALEQANIDISLFKDNRGQLINVLPDRVIVHPNNKYVVQRILGGTERSGTADRDINALRQTGDMNTSMIIVDPYLTSTSQWFVKTDQPGLIYFNRKDLVMTDDNEFDTENLKFKGQMRLSVGHSDWRAAYGVNI